MKLAIIGTVQSVSAETTRGTYRSRAYRRRSGSSGGRALDKAVAAATLTYRCARCGKTFTAPGDGSNRGGARSCVVIGGRRWCEPCARARYPRRPDPDALFGADRTPHPHWMKVR